MVATAQQNWSSQSAGKALTEQGTPLVMIITVRRVVHELYDGDDDDNHNHGCGKAVPSQNWMCCYSIERPHSTPGLL